MYFKTSFENRIQTRLEKLKRQVERGRLKKVSGIERRIGKIPGQNTRAESLFEVTLEETKAGKTLRVEKKRGKAPVGGVLSRLLLIERPRGTERFVEDLLRRFIT